MQITVQVAWLWCVQPLHHREHTTGFLQSFTGDNGGWCINVLICSSMQPNEAFRTAWLFIAAMFCSLCWRTVPHTSCTTIFGTQCPCTDQPRVFLWLWWLCRSRRIRIVIQQQVNRKRARIYQQRRTVGTATRIFPPLLPFSTNKLTRGSCRRVIVSQTLETYFPPCISSVGT